MIDLPVWRECRRCTRFVSTPEWNRCADPFPPSGECPLALVRDITLDHAYVYDTHYSHNYIGLLQTDARVASIFQRWRRGDIPNNSDFLYLRKLALDPEHFLRNEAPMHFLHDILFDTLVKLVGNFGAYNLGIPRPQPHEDPTGRIHAAALSSAWESVQAAVGYAIYNADPFFIESHAQLGGEWSRFMVDLIRIIIWHLHSCKHKRFTGKSDREFRVLFEAEWKELSRYQDAFYGFGVTPRISIKDMVRYQSLDSGKAEIRRAISAYLTHQATEYPHLIKPFAPQFADAAFERPLRESYGDLIHALTRQAWENLQGDGPSSPHQHAGEKQKVQSEIEQQLWKLFDQCRTDYEFYWNHPGRSRPLGKVGFVGLQTNEKKAALDRLAEERGLPIRSKDISEIAFAHFIKEKLRRWVQTNYPADIRSEAELGIDAPLDETGRTVAENLSGTNSWNIDSDHNTVSQPTSTFAGLDGQQYITINQAAKRWGFTVDQLRRLDRKGIVLSIRAKDICEQPCRLGDQVRMYALSAETDRALHLAGLRLSKHSSALEGTEIDRKTAAAKLKVSVATLRKWEDKGLVQPIRKGRIVVYNQQTLDQAEQAKNRNRTR